MDLKALADLTNLDTVEDAEKALDEDDNEVGHVINTEESRKKILWAAKKDFGGR